MGFFLKCAYMNITVILCLNEKVLPQTTRFSFFPEGLSRYETLRTQQWNSMSSHVLFITNWLNGLFFIPNAISFADLMNPELW